MNGKKCDLTDFAGWRNAAVPSVRSLEYLERHGMSLGGFVARLRRLRFRLGGFLTLPFSSFNLLPGQANG